jgi:hypothetical protein
MSHYSNLLGCLIVLLAATAVAQVATELQSGKAEPDLAYGAAAELPLPKTILFSAGPDEIAADAAEWRRHGVNAFFLDFVARDWSSDIWAADGEPWTIGASDKTFQKTKKATSVARELGSEVFLKVAFDHPFEWFNDTAWKQIGNNFQQMAIFARDTGCQGLALDIEYIGQQYDYNWAGYDYHGYTRAELFKKVQQRMTGVAQVMYEEFPDMVFLTFPECGLNLGTAIQVAWIEEAARRAAPGGFHYCTEYTYRNPNVRYMLAYAAQCHELFHRLLSPRAWRYWQRQCSVAAGVWPFGYDYQTTHDPGMPLDELRQGMAASLMVSRRYNWVYSHNCRDQLLGRKLEVYTNGLDIAPYLNVLAQRQVISDPKYVRLANEIRSVHLRDYSADLGLVSWVSFAGPNDTPTLRPMPAVFCNRQDQESAWRLALDYFRGREINLHDHFATLTDWQLIGPFPSDAKLSGHNTVSGPEQSLDLRSEYEGLNGKVRWQEYHQKGPAASVDLKKVFQPAEKVSAYALCFVTSPVEQDAQLRFSSNDAGKVWLGSQLVHDYPREGTVFLDRDIIPVHLPKGTTPLRLKITNNIGNWGFVARFTDPQGHPLTNLQFRLSPA